MAKLSGGRQYFVGERSTARPDVGLGLEEFEFMARPATKTDGLPNMESSSMAISGDTWLIP
jgi:hypothetical protein